MKPAREETLDIGGRAVAYCVWEEDTRAEESHALFLCHGTPGARLFHPFQSLEGRRYITFDRPGYGRSDPAPDLSVADVGGDIIALADHLAIERFGLIGISGGGPYALCAAARHPDWVEALALCGSVAPVSRGADTAGMMLINRLSFGMARMAPFLLWPVLSLMARQATHHPDRLIESMTERFAEVDQPILRRRDVQDMLRQDLPEVFRQGGTGLFHDMGRLVRNWGAAPQDVSVPTHIFQGGKDMNVPERMARQLDEQIPSAELHLDADAGHLLFLERWDEIVALLLNQK
ncbi:MAG: alpha/beta hydrolase [Alphaproteobacteria bacterium]|nr:alpha/beta hydrolase [Alphaproteobacteria bacterium]